MKNAENEYIFNTDADITSWMPGDNYEIIRFGDGVNFERSE